MQPSRPRLSSVRPFSRDFWLNLGTCMVAGAAISVLFQKMYPFCADFPFYFNGCLWGITGGAVVGLLLNSWHKKIPHAWRIQPMLIGFLRLFLAWIMLEYGGGKVIPLQFPQLTANMESTFLEMPPQRVAWTFFGYSNGYQMFLGWVETIPAFLLLFRRTYLFGAMLMVPVLVNVVAVNIFFDVCVKVNSSIYLCIAIFLLMNEHWRLVPVFFTGKAVPPVARTVLFENPKAHRLAGVLTGLLIVAILGLVAKHYWKGYHFNLTQYAKSPVYGVWLVNKMECLRDTAFVDVPPTDSLFIDRVYFQGNIGVFKGAGRWDRVRFQVDSAQQELNITFLQRDQPPLHHVWQYCRPDSLHLFLTGMFWEDSVQVECVLRE